MIIFWAAVALFIVLVGLALIGGKMMELKSSARTDRDIYPFAGKYTERE